jgi:hypothetical protein
VITSALTRITDGLRQKLLGQYIGCRSDYLRKLSSRNSSTISQETIRWFDAKWATLDTRLEIVPGKEVLHGLRDVLQSKYRVSLTNARIVQTFRVGEVPPDLVELIVRLDGFRKRVPARAT